MLITGHEPGLTASSARDTSLTAQYGSKHRQSSNSCASVALPHFPSARRATHASPTCGHERRAFAAVQRRVSDTRESDMCADCAFHERATPPARQIPAASDLDVEVDSRPSPQRKRTDTKGSAAESSVPTRSVGGAAREQRLCKTFCAAWEACSAANFAFNIWVNTTGEESPRSCQTQCCEHVF